MLHLDIPELTVRKVNDSEEKSHPSNIVRFSVCVEQLMKFNKFTGVIFNCGILFT